MTEHGTQRGTQEPPVELKKMLDEERKAREANPRPHDGPASYTAWKASLSRNEALPVEYPLYSDASFVGDFTSGFGPFKLLNSRIIQQSPNLPALFLRVSASAGSSVQSPFDLDTDVRGYHGGNVADEIAALVSLKLGCRLMAGGPSRAWMGDDPLGRPISGIGRVAPYLPMPSTGARVVPQLIGRRSLSDLADVDRYLSLAPMDASKLVRAARLYQEAAWIAESQPATSWLWLVAAVETVSSPWPEDKLMRPKPKASDGPGPRTRFIDLLLSFAPPPYAGCADRLWQEQELRTALGKIHDWRSTALHDGVPFPEAMSMPPAFTPEGASPYPVGVGVTSNGGSWRNEDTPMLLHAFVYLVRGALLRWWHESGRESPGEKHATP